MTSGFSELCAPVSVVASNSTNNAIQPTRGGLFGDVRTIHDQSSGPPITPVLKRPLQTTIKMKTLLTVIAVLCILASTSIAGPFYQTAALNGDSNCHPVQNFRYTVAFNNPFGGHWNLTGHSQSNRDGTYTDSFSGTVSDTTMQATVTRNNLDWVSDGWFLCHHIQVMCSSFSITISDGHISGFATYTP